MRITGNVGIFLQNIPPEAQLLTVDLIPVTDPRNIPEGKDILLKGNIMPQSPDVGNILQSTEEDESIRQSWGNIHQREDDIILRIVGNIPKGAQLMTDPQGMEDNPGNIHVNGTREGMEGSPGNIQLNGNTERMERGT